MEMPKFNHKVEFEVLRGPYAASYCTHVVGVDDQVITLVHPMVGGTLVLLKPGDAARLEYAIKGSARLTFITRVVDLDVRVLPVVLLSVPDEEQVERFQQRDFYRLDASLNLTYTILFSPDEVARPARVIHSRTRDISGSGAQILCPEPYPPGTQLDIHLQVEGHDVHVVGEVIRLVYTARPGEFWMGIRFVRLAERDLDLVIRSIFNEQRSRRSRGLL